MGVDGSFSFEGVTKAISLIIDFNLPEAMLSFDDIESHQNYDFYSIEYTEMKSMMLPKGSMMPIENINTMTLTRI